MNHPTPLQLAKKFSALLLDQIGAEKMTEVIRKNAGEANKLSCASHDFCDANMVMSDAIVTLSTFKVDLTDTLTTGLWNAAWTIAKEANFYHNPEVDVGDVIAEAMAMFWEHVVSRYPTATHGDLSPVRVLAFEAAATHAVNEWVEFNVPYLNPYKEAGYEREQTGGGCTSYVLRQEHGGKRVMLTAQDDSSIPENYAGDVLMGVYQHDECEGDFYITLPHLEAIKLGKVIIEP